MKETTVTAEAPAQAKPAPPPLTDAQVEAKAMGDAYRVLKVLDYGSRHRALHWLSQRFDADHNHATQQSDDPWAREEAPF